MALYRCASCGSPNVSLDSQEGGVSYNYAKGIAGTVILGAGGGAAGIESKSRMVYKCADCGLTLSYCMPASTKKAIDVGVQCSSMRDMLYDGDIRVSWEYLTSKYKNIESGEGDAYLREEQAKNNEMANAAMEKFAGLARDIALYQENPAAFNAHYDELYKLWEEKNMPLLTQKEEEYEQVLAELKNEEARETDEIKKRYEEAVKGLTQPLLQEKEATEQKLATLKFYQFGAKSEAKDRLAELENLLAAAENKKKAVEKKKNDQEGSVWRRYREKTKQNLLAIEKKYPIEKNPDLYRKRIIRFTYDVEYARDISHYPNMVWYYLSEIMAYCVILTMQEWIGGLGISYGYLDIDLKGRSVHGDGINEIGRIALPTMLQVFDIRRYDRNEIKCDNSFGSNFLKNLAKEDILQLREENGKEYYVVM